VPNEANQAQQAINFFTMPTTPPAWSSPYQLTANDIKFFGKALSANQVVKPTAPIVIQKDEWVGVLGACQAQGGTSMYNSYGGSGAVSTTVLGLPVTLQPPDLPGHPGGSHGRPRDRRRRERRLHRPRRDLRRGQHHRPDPRDDRSARLRRDPQFDMKARSPASSSA
jgi:hypothetical protein